MQHFNQVNLHLYIYHRICFRNVQNGVLKKAMTVLVSVTCTHVHKKHLKVLIGMSIVRLHHNNFDKSFDQVKINTF